MYIRGSQRRRWMEAGQRPSGEKRIRPPTRSQKDTSSQNTHHITYIRAKHTPPFLPTLQYLPTTSLRLRSYLSPRVGTGGAVPCHPGWTTDQIVGCSLLLLSFSSLLLPLSYSPLVVWGAGYWPFASRLHSSHPPSVMLHAVRSCLVALLFCNPARRPSASDISPSGGLVKSTVVW